MRAFYDDFSIFTRDQELLVSIPDLVDYVEGFIVLNEQSLHSSSIAFPANVDFNPDFGTKNSPKIYYCIEFAVHEYQHKNTNVHHVSSKNDGITFLRRRCQRTIRDVLIIYASVSGCGSYLEADEPHGVPVVQCGGFLFRFP